jgi:hypothetical protein
MKTMKSVRIKPNPTGKDRTRLGATATQLGAEWVDLKNEGATAVVLDGLSLFHVAYSGATDKGTWKRVTGFTGQLGGGKVMRLHSGSGPVSILNLADLQGADAHVFTNRDSYIWNNDRGDCSAMQKDGETAMFDQCWYDSKPPEGVVLARVSNKFVAPTTSTATVGGRR